MTSVEFDVKICKEALLSSIEANQPHHDNILQTLLRFQEDKHDEVISINGVSALISTLEPPQFLRCDALKSPHYVLVQSYQRKKSKGSDQCTSTPDKNRKFTSESDFQTDSDISGAPLESPFAVHESDNVFSPLILRNKQLQGREEMSFNGFTLTRTREISSEIRSVLRRRDEASDVTTPIFVVCDGLNSQKTIFLGVGSGILIRASCSPVFHGPEQLPTICDLTYDFVYGCYSKEVETSAEASYEVLKRTNNESSSVTIHSSWKRPSGMLSPPTVDLFSNVELFVCPSDPNNAAHTLQQELHLLESLIVGSAAGEVLWNVKGSQHSVDDQLNKLFDEVNERKREKPDQSLFELDNLIEQRFSQVRQNIDFTDQIWNVLKDSESYSELEAGFGSVFEAINTDFIRPFVHELDVTKFAKACKELMRGEKTVNITDLEPLKMIIEIGLEKMKRDFMSVFLASELITNDELETFISWSSTKDNPEQCVNLLKKLCLTLQCIVLLRKYINLPPTVLSQCTSNIFKHVLNSESTPQTFNFPVQNFFLQEQFSSVSLYEWAFKISCSSNADRPKQQVYRVTKSALFPNLSGEDSASKENVLSTKYYAFNLLVLPDSFIP